MPNPTKVNAKPNFRPRTDEERAQLLQETKDRIAKLTPEQKHASLERQTKAMGKT
jgi:hypothetical protein